METLALVGRNKVVYSLGAASSRYVTWPGDRVAHVASYLPLDDLCLGSPRCVDKEWRFHSDRSLRLRLDEVRSEIDRSDGRLYVALEPPRNHLRARRVANAAELRSALDEEGSWARSWRCAIRLAAAVHGVVLGPAYVSYPHQTGRPFLFVERAQLCVRSGCYSFSVTVQAPANVDPIPLSHFTERHERKIIQTAVRGFLARRRAIRLRASVM